MNATFALAPSASIRPFAKKVRRIFTYGTLVQPRAYLLIAFVGYLLIGPVSAQTDIVAAVFCYSLLAILLLVALITVVCGYRIRQTLTLQVIDPSSGRADGAPAEEEGGGVVSGEPSGLALRIAPFAVPPFFVLYVRLELEHEELVVPLHQLTGKSAAPSVLSENIVFPHRGLWKILRARVLFGDQFGFTRDHWEIDAPEVARAVTVRPPELESTTLPVLSSSFRSGEMMVDAVENRGEMFDIKRYHPSDGIQRIIWKIYARRGELMSRHPERAVTPEGQVVAFVLADTGDDHVCSEALAYLRTMEELDLLVWAGCRGMGTERAARNSADALKLFIETAWSAGQSNPDACRAELYGLIDEVQRSLSDAALERVLLFCSAEHAAEAEGLALCRRIGEALSARRMMPVFILVPKAQRAGVLPAARPAARGAARWRAAAERLLVYPHKRGPAQPVAAESAARELARVCASRQWELIIA
jgi:hypothetical protein